MPKPQLATALSRRRSHQPVATLLKNNEWRIFVAAVLMTALVPLLIHMRISPIAADGTRPDALLVHRQLDAQRHKIARSNTGSVSTVSEEIIQAADAAEQEILNFFHGKDRALRDGVPFGGDDDASTKLAGRLADRIQRCQTEKLGNDCVLRVVYIGSAQTTGRDNFFNQTYPFSMAARLQAVTDAAGLELQVWNHAMDSDLHREGPQSTHMCVSNFMGSEPVDVIGWDFDGGMQAKPSAQVEAFVRWTLLSQADPAMILMNRGGPHGQSRRGKQRAVVNLGPGHDAFVYEDDPNDMPQARPDNEVYKESKDFQGQWQKGRNSFWEVVFQKYASLVDFAAVDPKGSIWHLDHLENFSNQAFDAGKALPLIDCGPAHPPPCNQIPEFVAKHLARANLTEAVIPHDDVGGAVCSSMLGCRHVWYGGKRSHALRGELNALPILRALRHAAKILSSAPFRDSPPKGNDNNDAGRTSSDQIPVSATTNTNTLQLPPPEYCSETFCSLKPNCITAYIPNRGSDLGSAILSNETFPAHRPRKGASHFLDDPSKQIHNLDIRFEPLGYRDRKFGYRLSAINENERAKKKKKNIENEDASTTAVAFTTDGPGPLVLCEPPCFIDSCSKRRKMPIAEHVTLELDGAKLELKHLPSAIEVGGPFCQVISGSVEKGDHILRMSTKVEDPDHVMFSHVIPFS